MVEQGHAGPARLIASCILAAVRQSLPDQAPDEIVKPPLCSLKARPGTHFTFLHLFLPWRFLCSRFGRGGTLARMSVSLMFFCLL